MRNKAVTVSQLRDQIGIDDPREFLKCFRCGAEYSANRADYFMARTDHVFKCCGRNMALVVRETIYRTHGIEEN